MPRIYVGTYAKYNNGSLAGAWLDLGDYRDAGEFYGACLQLHADESDPELMFQDWEGIPGSGRFIGESHLADDLWPNWLCRTEAERKVLKMAWEHVDSDMSPEQALDQYAGSFDCEEDWAFQFWEDTGMFDEIPEFAQNYIDFTAYARDCLLGGGVTFVREMGQVHVFRNN